MKKNISINISGIIFHIEEDGYENLRKYLDSINRYFSSFEDSSEILADIESRIAEIFLSKLNEGKQVITAEDVNSLIATMGSVSDFKAAEEQDAPEAGSAANDNKRTEEETTSAGSTSEQHRRTGYTEPRKLYRDQKRKILGGVCSGMANYFNIDPVWIRLFFALFTVAYGVGFLVYVVFWIAVPGSFELMSLRWRENSSAMRAARCWQAYPAALPPTSASTSWLYACCLWCSPLRAASDCWSTWCCGSFFLRRAASLIACRCRANL
ncbi:MAG: PspC domain-containing protein [Bacteroidia bacterium]|nr:PspC domain-containing protein [Bacteroidia bacterium]